MKREIKFKAKRLDGKGWVEGSLIRSTTGIKERAYIVDNFSSMSDYSVIGVDPSTVCQFTGMKGCEGNKIWEGDIISSPHFERVATVKWDDSLCGFKCSDVTGNINFIFEAIANCSEWSIIGNKFDKEK